MYKPKNRLLRAPAIAVVGVGALGSEVSRLLAAVGTSRVLLVDHDALQPHNLRCSTFLAQAFAFVKQSEPVRKAELLAGEAARGHGLVWQHCTAELADAGLGLLRDYDVLCCCTDSALSRAETALAARLLGMPMLDCAVFGHEIDEGRVTWYPAGQDAACYLCGLSEQTRARLLAYAASTSMGCMPPAADVPMTGTSAAVRHTAAVALRLLAAEVPNKATTEKGSRAPDGQWRTEIIGHGRSATCPWHDGIGSLMPLHPEETFAELLRRADAGSVVRLHWPVCLEAVCRQCGRVSRPMRRVAWVRRTLVCGGCGAAGMAEPRHSIHSIAAADESAQWTPKELHLSAHELYSVGSAFASRTASPGAYV